MSRAFAIGSNLFFAREGDVIDGVTVGRDAKPDNDPATNYMQFGCVQDSEFLNNFGESIEIYCPSPGHLELDEIIELIPNFSIVASVQKWQEIDMELALQADRKLVQGEAFIPGARSSSIRGWLKGQFYSHSDEEIIAFDMWVQLSMESYTFSARGADPHAITFRRLQSDLNTAVVTNIAA